MSTLLVDLEKGAAALVHELTEPPSDGSQLPEAGLKAAAELAEHLGLDATTLGPKHLGWLFDLVDAAVTAATAPAEGHAQAGAPSTPPESAGAPESAPEAPKPPETAPGSEPSAPPPAAEPATPPSEPAVPPSSVDEASALGQLTEASAGLELCPTCQGFRTIVVNGQVELCPTCHGVGEVAAGSTAPPSAA